MKKYQTYNFENTEYYLINDLHAFDKSFFYGCRNNPKNLIKKKKIANEDLYFAYTKDDDWVKSHSKYNKAKIFITKDWIFDNVPNAFKKSQVIADINPLPPKIILDDYQKFCDAEYEYDITIRGEREFNKCYFRVQDIEELFELKSLNKRVSKKESSFIKNVDYKIFTFTNGRPTIKNKNKRKTVMTKYFTYGGLIKCLYISKSKQAHRFREWANKILFAHQFGSVKEKQELSSKLLGIHIKAVRQVFKTNATTTPCVYLFTLGVVKDLRKSMNIPKTMADNMIICKYGFTKDLQKRAYEHNKILGKIKNVQLALKYYAYVDPQYISAGECDIRDYFNDINAQFDYKDYNELIILDQKKLNNTVKKQYTNLSKSYGGHITEFITKIKQLEDKIMFNEEKHKRELSEERHKYELALKDQKLLQKETELLILKLELANRK